MNIDFLKLAVDDMCCLVITDEKGNYLYANKAWSAIMERSFDEKLIGHPVSEVIKDTQIEKALKEVDETGNLPIPKYLQDAHYKGAKDLNRGIGYKYPHDYPGHYVDQQYLPDEIKNEKFFEDR